MSPEAELMLAQVCDPTFPIGAYAHSFGLETYVQRGVVDDPKSAADYVRQQLEGPLCYTELLGMRLAFERACDRDAKGLARLEAWLAAYRAPSELREASRKLGGRFCRTACELLDEDAREPGCDRDACSFFLGYAQTGAHHLNTAFGAFAPAAGIPLADLLRRYLYAQVSAMVTCCVKAVPLSQTAGQRIVRQSYCAQTRCVEKALAAAPEELGRSSPGFDVRSIEHETLYTRLFMS